MEQVIDRLYKVFKNVIKCSRTLHCSSSLFSKRSELFLFTFMFSFLFPFHLQMLPYFF